MQAIGKLLVPRLSRFLCSLALAALLLLGPSCATTGDVDGGAALTTLQSPAWTYRSGQDRFTVAVSPARQTLQFGGTTGLVIGGSISMVSNARHRGPIDDMLEGYDAGGFLEARLESALHDAWLPSAPRVEPMRSTTGYQDRREAEREYYRELNRQGIDGILVLESAYGLFGPQGTLAVRLDASIDQAQGGRTRWRRHVLATSEAPLLGARWTDPTRRMAGDWRSPRLTVEEDAISQWTVDDGTLLTSTFETLAEGAVAALLSDLGLEVSANGLYYLGMQALYEGETGEAFALFNEALAGIAPENALWGRLQNAIACSLWEDGQPAVALEHLEQTLARIPDDATTQYNLAYALASQRQQLDRAAEKYHEAREQGMPRSNTIERSLENAGITL